MEINVLIVHFNTPELITAAIKSINKNTKCKIYVFENSDKRPFVNSFDNVEIIDNTKGQIIDFEKWLAQYPNRFNSISYGINNFGSPKHCISIQKGLEIINKPLILLDSDILLKKDISELVDLNYIYVADQHTRKRITRVLPYICFINVPMLKEKGIGFFNENKMHGLGKNPKAELMDTGASFYEDTLNEPHKRINCYEYIEHYGSGSWNNITKKRRDITPPEVWINKNKNLWE